MKSDSIQLAWAGAMIGVLVLSATVFAGARPPARRSGESGTAEARAVFASDARAAAPETGDQALFFSEAAAVPVMAEEEAPRYSVTLRLEPGVDGRLFLCDAAGCPLEEIRAGAGEEAELGSLAPGQYSLYRGETELGRFRLQENAVLSQTKGLLRTDGKRLFLTAEDP